MHFQDQTYTQEPMVMKCEVRKALRETTGNKATGADELPIELIKAAGEVAITVLTLRRLMSYIYGAPILDVSRSHTTTQHSR